MNYLTRNKINRLQSNIMSYLRLTFLENLFKSNKLNMQFAFVYEIERINITYARLFKIYDNILCFQKKEIYF